MSKAVQFDGYGDIDVLEVREIARPSAAEGEVLVDVKATGINPGGGEGVDGVSVGGEVLGFSESRNSQAEFVAVPSGQLTPKPAGVSWEVAGGLFVAGTTAYAAVRSLGLTESDTVAVAGAAGGVGSIAVQLVKRTGATVLGIAGPDNDEWLVAHGVIRSTTATTWRIGSALRAGRRGRRLPRLLR